MVSASSDSFVPDGEERGDGGAMDGCSVPVGLDGSRFDVGVVGCQLICCALGWWRKAVDSAVGSVEAKALSAHCGDGECAVV